MGVNAGDASENMLKTDTIQVTQELLALIAEIDEFKGAWRALGTLAPKRLRALRHTATIESIGSSTRIEGGKLTDRPRGGICRSPGDFLRQLITPIAYATTRAAQKAILI